MSKLLTLLRFVSVFFERNVRNVREQRQHFNEIKINFVHNQEQWFKATLNYFTKQREQKYMNVLVYLRAPPHFTVNVSYSRRISST